MRVYLHSGSVVLTLSFVIAPNKLSYFIIFMHTHFIFFPCVYLKLAYVINVEQSEQDMKQEPPEWVWVGHRCKEFRSTRCLLTFVSKGTAWSPSPSRCVAIRRGRDQSLDGFSWRSEVMPAAAPAASLHFFQPGSGTKRFFPAMGCSHFGIWKAETWCEPGQRRSSFL